MKEEVPPKVLALSRKEAKELLKKLQNGTATLEERQEVIAILKSYREVMHFIEHADKRWDDHVLEVEHEWRKKKDLKELK